MSAVYVYVLLCYYLSVSPCVFGPDKFQGSLILDQIENVLFYVMNNLCYYFIVIGHLCPYGRDLCIHLHTYDDDDDFTYCTLNPHMTCR